MADRIEWYLDANTSKVRSEMLTTMQTVGTATAKMQRDIDGVSSTHNNLLRSDHRVAASLRGLTTDALRTGDAMGSLGTLFESLAMATNVSLPALIGLEIVGKIIQDVAKAHAEAVKLNKELDAAAKPREAKSSVPIAEDIRQRRETIEKARKDIEEKSANPWITGTNWMWKSWEAITSRNREGPSADRYKDFDRSALQRGEGSAAFPARNPAARDLEALEIEERKVKAAEDATAAIEKQAEAEKRLKELAETVAKGKTEKLQFSLAELAKEGREWAPGDDSRPGAKRLARQAMGLEAKARKAMLAEHYQEAFGYQSQADAIKNSIIPLKDNEKDFLNALDRAVVLHQQLEQLRAISNRISFGGK